MAPSELRPFAFLRLTHEAIRVACGQCTERAASETPPDGQDLRSLGGALDETLKLIHLHARQEDNGLYPLIDEHFDGVAKNEAYREEHVELEKREDALRELVRAAESTRDDASWSAARDAVIEWAKNTEEHLKHEEDVLQPYTTKLTDADVSAACGYVHDIIDSADRAATETWQVGWIARKLDAGRPIVKLKKFVLALQHSSTADEFQRMLSTLRDALPESSWSALEADGLCEPGLLVLDES